MGDLVDIHFQEGKPRRDLIDADFFEDGENGDGIDGGNDGGENQELQQLRPSRHRQRPQLGQRQKGGGELYTGSINRTEKCD